MKPEFTLQVSITDRQVVLTTDTDNSPLSPELTITLHKYLNTVRNRIKRHIDKVLDEHLQEEEKAHTDYLD